MIFNVILALLFYPCAVSPLPIIGVQIKLNYVTRYIQMVFRYFNIMFVVCITQHGLILLK